MQAYTQLLSGRIPLASLFFWYNSLNCTKVVSGGIFIFFSFLESLCVWASWCSASVSFAVRRVESLLSCLPMSAGLTLSLSLWMKWYNNPSQGDRDRSIMHVCVVCAASDVSAFHWLPKLCTKCHTVLPLFSFCLISDSCFQVKINILINTYLAILIINKSKWPEGWMQRYKGGLVEEKLATQTYALDRWVPR